MSPRRRDVVLAYLLVAVALVAARPYLHGHDGIQGAAVFSVIVSAISWLAGILNTVGTAISSTLVGAVTYLLSAVGWLAARVAGILASTGGMFARVWEGARIVWTDAIKPALLWVDNVLKRVQGWLKDTFAPVFEWLQRVRGYIDDVYKRFVRPIIDTIEFIRQLNRVLLTFHITVLQQLDDVLAALERRIEEPILWLYARLSEVQNAVNFIVTADGFFQRVALLRSMDKYAPAWIQMWWKTSSANIDAGKSAELAAMDYATVDPAELVVEFRESMRGDGGKMDSYTSELADDLRRQLAA